MSTEDPQSRREFNLSANRYEISPLALTGAITTFNPDAIILCNGGIQRSPAVAGELRVRGIMALSLQGGIHGISYSLFQHFPNFRLFYTEEQIDGIYAAIASVPNIGLVLSPNEVSSYQEDIDRLRDLTTANGNQFFFNNSESGLIKQIEAKIRG